MHKQPIHQSTAKFIAAVMIVMLVLVALPVTPAHAADRTASVSGNWSDTATWGGATVPTSADDVTINDGINLTVDGNYTCSSLTFFSKTSGGADVTGTLTVNSPNSLTVTNAITVPSGKADGTFTITGSGTVSSATLSINDAGAGGNPTTTFTLTSTITTFNVSGNVSLVGTVTTNKYNNPVLNLNGG